MEDCFLTTGNHWFRYRAAAIIVEDGCVLFAGNDVDDYLYSVGGAVHLGETAEDAVVREVLEETGVRYEIDRLAVIHENFFTGTSSDRELQCHEIAFYFRMKPRGSKALNASSVASSGARETMHWVAIEELDRVKAFPTFLKDYLSREHNGVEHIVTDERNN
ncbi:MAG: NUDIX hydrolase [Faecousia sp.]